MIESLDEEARASTAAISAPVLEQIENEAPVNYFESSTVTVIGRETTSGSRPWYKSRWFWVGMLLVALLLISLAIGISLTDDRKKKNLSPSAAHGNPGSVTATVDYEIRFLTFRTDIGRLTDPSTLLDPDSPQSQALDWLVYQDRTVFPDDSRKLVQRFAIMVLFYACNGKDWQSFSPSLDQQNSVDECNNFGIVCNDRGSIIILDLKAERLTGRIPEEIGLLKELTVLDLSRNFLEGPIPGNAVGKLTKLEKLSLEYNELGSSLPSEIGHLTELTSLAVNFNYLTGTLPSEYIRLPKLAAFNSNGNIGLTGPFQEHLIAWTNLQEFFIPGTRFTGSIPDEIGELSDLRRLSFDDTILGGTVPSSLRKLTNLETLFLGSLSMSMNMTSIIGNLSSLMELSIRDLTIQGNVPTRIGALSNLEFAQITGAALTGTLPTEVGLLTKLRVMILDDTTMTGSLPSEIGYLTKLETLQITRNNFSGIIPQSYCNILGQFFFDCSLSCSCCKQNCVS